MIINVLQSHIDEGCRNNGHCCMLAKAILERCPHLQLYASYGGDNGEKPYVHIWRKDSGSILEEARDIALSKRVGKLMAQFDANKNLVNPFKFSLRLPKNLVK